LDILDPAQLPKIEAEPLGRRDRRRRRQDLRQHRPQQPGLAASESRSGPGLQAQRPEVGHAPLRIGDAGRPAPRIAGMKRLNYSVRCESNQWVRRRASLSKDPLQDRALTFNKARGKLPQ
jgi:hypothetical protein